MAPSAENDALQKRARCKKDVQVEGDSGNPTAREPRGLGDHKDFFRTFSEEFRGKTVGEIKERAEELSASNLEFREHWEDLVHTKERKAAQSKAAQSKAAERQRKTAQRKAAMSIHSSVRALREIKSHQANKEVTAEIVPPAESKAVSGTLDVAVAGPDAQIQFHHPKPKSGQAFFSQADADYFRSIFAPGGEQRPGAFSKSNIQRLNNDDQKFKEIFDRYVDRRMRCEGRQRSEEEARKEVLHIMMTNVNNYRKSFREKQEKKKQAEQEKKKQAEQKQKKQAEQKQKKQAEQKQKVQAEQKQKKQAEQEK